MHSPFATRLARKTLLVTALLAASAACDQSSGRKVRQGMLVSSTTALEAGAPALPSGVPQISSPPVKTVVEPHVVLPLQLSDDVQDKFARAHTNFAWNLFRRLAESRAEENFVYSPLAIQFALGIAVVGARGAGENRLARSMAPGVKPEHIYEVMQSWQEQLLRSMNSQVQPGTERVGVLKFGNSLWLDDSVQPNSAFVDKIRPHYGFGVFRVPLHDSANSALGPINQWVSDQTESRIVQLVKSLSPTEQALLTSVAYFKTKFTSPFGSVEPEPFASKTGSKSSVDTMHNVLRAKYIQNLAYQAVELDLVYGATSLVSVMPLAGSVSGFARALSGQKWTQLLTNLEHNKGTIDLHWPKLNLRSRYEKMQSTLDLPSGPLALPFIAPSCELSSWVHEATFVVSQDGIEVPSAAGTSAQSGAPADDKDSNSHVIRFDHPFLFAVIHRLTGSILLAGQVVSP